MEQENTLKRKRGRPKGSKNKKKRLDETHFLLITELDCMLNMALYSKIDINCLEAKAFHIHYLLCELILDLKKNKQMEEAKELEQFL
jgi:hypothetical protein